MPSLMGGFGNVHFKYLCSRQPELAHAINNNTFFSYCISSNFFRVRPNLSALFAALTGKAEWHSPSLEQELAGLDHQEILKYSGTNLESNSLLGPYLAGLIEGDGTIAVHDTKSTALKYRPIIIVVFKKADLPLAEYLKNLTNCGSVYIKSDRGYILWQIQDIISVYTIVTLINGHMRTPKIEALKRTIFWLNEYIANNKNSKLPSTRFILSKINLIKFEPMDNSPIDSNPWLSGFSDADANFSINIHKRSNRIQQEFNYFIG